MNPAQLHDLVEQIRVPGWRFTTTGWEVRVEVEESPADAWVPKSIFTGLGDMVMVHPKWTQKDIVQRLFCHLQFLIDHELRENFTVNGEHIFDPHSPSLTGQQHDWFVEHQSALTGY